MALHHCTNNMVEGLPWHLMPRLWWQELLGQLVFISARPLASRVHGKDEALLFRVEKGQFLRSGQQTEHKRHTELDPQAAHGWEMLTAS